MGTHPWVAVPGPPEFRLHAAGFWGRVATLSAVLTERQPDPAEFSFGGGSPERLREVIRGVRESQPTEARFRALFSGSAIDEVVRRLAAPQEQITRM